jgi:hypothetical protein
VKNEEVSDCGPKRSEKVLVEYLERRPAVVPGPVSGRAYAFSALHAVQAVLADDAEALERTGYFRRLG